MVATASLGRGRKSREDCRGATRATVKEGTRADQGQHARSICGLTCNNVPFILPAPRPDQRLSRDVIFNKSLW